MLSFFNIQFLNMLDDFLGIWGTCVSVQRWGSSELHQWEINKLAPKSWHTKWRAVDLVFDDEKNIPAACVDAQRIGFTGIEWDLTNNHLHLDNRDTPQWYVVQTKDGHYVNLTTYLTTL